MATPTTPTRLSGYQSQDAIARAGSYHASAGDHQEREHVRQDGRLYARTPFGGLVACDRPGCIERYPECARIACATLGGTNVATHRVRTSKGIDYYLCDQDTSEAMEWSLDPIEYLECLSDAAHSAAAMPLECTCR